LGKGLYKDLDIVADHTVRCMHISSNSTMY